MPAGERARKRRAAQAALLRGASRTPLARGHLTPASAGVPLSFSCWKRVDKWRFVDETASIVRSELLRGFVVTGKTRAQKKTRRENGQPYAEVLGALAPSLEG